MTRPRIVRVIAPLLGGLVALAACSPGTPGVPSTPSPSPPALAASPALTVAPPAPAPATPPASPATAATARRVTAATTRASPATPTTAAREVIRFSAVPTDPGAAQVASVRPDGTGRQVLAALPGHPWGPRASPDGTLLLFSSAAPAVVGRAADLDLNGSGSPDIWVAAADGSRARPLTDAPAGYNGWSWSPDGRRIAFASNRNGTWDIYTLALAGGAPIRLTTSPAQDGWPVWTPDGREIVFASTRSDRAQIYRMAADGSSVRRLLASPTADTEPAIAPGGAITFSTQNPDGTGEIYVLDGGAAAPRRLTSAGGLSTSPTCSPDGRQIAFVNRRDGRSDLYAVNLDGSGLVRLTTTGQNQRPDWGAAPTAAPLVVPLAAQNDSGQAETATLTDLGDGTTRVVVELANPPAGPQPLHIHEGTCAGLSAQVQFPLADLVGGRSETVVPVSLATLLASPHAINAHKSRQEPTIYVACGEIAPSPG